MRAPGGITRRRRLMPAAHRGMLWVVVASCVPAAVAQAPREQWPAEETRLDPSAFRAGLKERGLIELLELHLRDYPPENATSRLLLTREIKLAQFADPTLPQEQRRDALAQANRLLAQLIDARPDHPQRFEWRITLAHSLIYDEGYPYITGILSHGGSAEDRRRLVEMTSRAVTILEALRAEIATEYERLDGLSITEFESLERRGWIEALEQLAPRADYLLLWALLYDCVPREDADPLRARRLNQTVDLLHTLPELLDTPHEQSGLQVQALLLAGMTYRMLNDHRAAREHLEHALAVARRLGEKQRAEIDWAVTLAWMERIRNESEAGRFADALNELDRLRNLLVKQPSGDSDLWIVAALLERSVFQERAQLAERAGRESEADEYRTQAWQSLARLVQNEPALRDRVYAILYDSIGPDADPETLDPFEQCVLIARLLFESNQARGQLSDAGAARAPLLDRAVAVSEHFLSRAGRTEADLVPEVLYNSAVALYGRGRSVEAARRFLRIARDHEGFNNALRASELSVQVCAELYRQETARANEALRSLYLDALRTLMTNHPGTEQAEYWRFFYGQVLEDAGRFDTAATEFSFVGESHDYYLESIFGRVRCLFLDLQKRVIEGTGDSLDIRSRIVEFTEAHRDLNRRISTAIATERDDDRRAMLRLFEAEAAVIFAEVQILPEVERPTKALDALAEFERDHPQAKALIGRVLRVRMLAYEKLGRLEEATRSIPAYVESDPENAGPTLQSLYVAMVADIERLEETDDTQAALRKAKAALLLADQIDAWASRSSETLNPNQRQALAVQLAEANLRADRYDRARELFADVLGLTGAEAVSESLADGLVRNHDARAVIGYAESVFQLGEHAKALPLFNRLATTLPASEPTRWQSLLRDLQCRTALGEPPAGIIKVIEQQRYLYPELGGARFAKAFGKLLRENKKRVP
jgi:hypothetical protein